MGWIRQTGNKGERMAVNLDKGQRISLEKEAGKGLSRIFMGLGWDAAKAAGQKKGGFLSGLTSLFSGGGGGGAPDNIDLDASCVVFSEGKDVLETIYFGNLKSRDGSIVHTGDNLTGDGDGDDEVINVDLARIPADAKYLVFTVNSYRGQTFDEVDNAFCRLVDAENGKEVARYAISGGGPHTAMIMAKLYRHNGEWKMQAVGEPMTARTAFDMTEPIRAIL